MLLRYLRFVLMSVIFILVRKPTTFLAISVIMTEWLADEGKMEPCTVDYGPVCVPDDDGVVEADPEVPAVGAAVAAALSEPLDCHKMSQIFMDLT